MANIRIEGVPLAVVTELENGDARVTGIGRNRREALSNTTLALRFMAIHVAETHRGLGPEFAALVKAAESCVAAIDAWAEPIEERQYGRRGVA
jgi:hypothetical protein